MRIIVLSDVHGNLPALEKLLNHEHFDLCVSLGDVVNYGPWSNECVELLDALPNKILLRGNHEDYYLKGVYENTTLSGRFFDYCYPDFRRFDLIRKYIISITINDYLYQHTIDDRIIYPDTHLVFDQNYIIGHSHHQSLQECGKYKLYAIGSVGQNRQYINQIDYLIIDKCIELKHLIYDENLIIGEMKARNYPREFIEYYSKKQRV